MTPATNTARVYHQPAVVGVGAGGEGVGVIRGQLTIDCVARQSDTLQMRANGREIKTSHRDISDN